MPERLALFACTRGRRDATAVPFVSASGAGEARCHDLVYEGTIVL